MSGSIVTVDLNSSSASQLFSAARDITHAWQDAISDRHASLQVKLQNSQKATEEQRRELIARQQAYELERDEKEKLEDQLETRRQEAAEAEQKANEAQARVNELNRQRDENKTILHILVPWTLIPKVGDGVMDIIDAISGAERERDDANRALTTARSAVEAKQKTIDALKPTLEAKQRSVQDKLNQITDLRKTQKELTRLISSLGRTLDALMKPSVSDCLDRLSIRTPDYLPRASRERSLKLPRP